MTLTLRELTEAWMQGLVIPWQDANGLHRLGIPVAVDLAPGEVNVRFEIWRQESRSLSVRFRLVPTSRFDKIRHEFEVDLEPMPCN